MALSKEELVELKALEVEEQKRQGEEADAVARQHLEALRMRKRLAAKHGVHGRDFLVLETTVGNFALRRPSDVEIDGLGENPDDRAAHEAFLAGIVIEPSSADALRLFGEYPGLTNALIPRTYDMLGRVRAEEAKK